MLKKGSRRRVLPMLIAGVAAMSLAAGCASGSTTVNAQGKGGSVATAKAPNSITVAYVGQIQSLDPLLGYGLQDINALGLFGEGLYEFRYGTGSKPQPGLAQSASVSKDQLTWTFHLRPHLKFSDGTPLTSKDVKATLDRAITDKANVWSSFAQPIKSVSAPDSSTVVLKLRRPYPSLPTILAESGFAIFPALLTLPWVLRAPEM